MASVAVADFGEENWRTSSSSAVGTLPTPTVNGQSLKGWKVVKSGNDLKLRKASGVLFMVQ